MSDELENRSWARLGVAAALGREYAADGKAFLEFFARFLKAAMSDETEIRTRGLFKKSVAAVVVDLGGTRYTVEDLGRGPLVAARTQVVRGIALKTEPISVEECLSELTETLEQQAGQNGRARQALAEILGLE